MSSNTPHTPFLEQFTLKELGNNEYETLEKPKRVGNPLPVAYGGYSLGVACKAATLSVPKGYHLYSIVGNYLGPASTDLHLLAKIKTIRQTRTFATRYVEVGQVHPTGEFKACLVGIADFQVAEPKSLLQYSRKPTKSYPSWRECPTSAENNQKLLSEGKINKKLLAMFEQSFSIFPALYDQRAIPSAIFAQNLGGIAKTAPHSQDHLPPAQRTTADWFKAREELHSPADQVANLAFLIDGAVAFQALSFNHLFFDDVAAASSLDFALRVFQNGKGEEGGSGLNMNQWHLREMNSSVAENGRTFGESWIWDEQGNAVACMSQQCILRPKAEKKAKI